MSNVTEIGSQGVLVLPRLHQPPHQFSHAHLHVPFHERHAGRQRNVVQVLGQHAQVLAVPFVRDPKPVVESFTLRLRFFHLVKLRFSYYDFHQTHPIHHAGIVQDILDLHDGLMVDRDGVGPQTVHQLATYHEHAWVDGIRESRHVQGGVGGRDGRQPHLPSFPLQFQRHGQAHFARTGGVAGKLFRRIADQHDAIHAWKCNVTCVSPTGFKVINWPFVSATSTLKISTVSPRTRSYCTCSGSHWMGWSL